MRYAACLLDVMVLMFIRRRYLFAAFSSLYSEV